MTAGGFGFWQGLAGIGLGVEELALQVAFLNVIAVDETQGSQTGAGEQCGLDCPEGATAYDYGGGRRESPLAFKPERDEADLAAKPFAI